VPAADPLTDLCSEAQQLRGRIAIRTREYAPVSVHCVNAPLALGRFWEAVGLAAMWPPDAQAPPFRLSEQVEKMKKAESDFTRRMRGSSRPRGATSNRD
jgi:hypothetical protein